LPRYYAIADIFVLASPQETWGLVINEAMCSALPIITTSGVTASYDLVFPQENGCIVPVRDVQAIASCLHDLVQQPLKLRKMGDRSLEIISKWNYDACVNGFIGALEYVHAN